MVTVVKRSVFEPECPALVTQPPSYTPRPRARPLECEHLPPGRTKLVLRTGFESERRHAARERRRNQRTQILWQCPPVEQAGADERDQVGKFVSAQEQRAG